MAAPGRAGIAAAWCCAGAPGTALRGSSAATRHFLNFFTASIRNRHTRRAYARQALGFLRWCEARGCHELRAITTAHVSTYIEQLTRSELDAPSVKYPGRHFRVRKRYHLQ